MGAIFVAVLGYGLSGSLFGIGSLGLAGALLGKFDNLKNPGEFALGGIGFMFVGFALAVVTAKLTGAL